MVIPIEDLAILVIMGINIVLTVILATVYTRNYKAISSKLTLGMLFFAIAFLLENLVNLVFYWGLLSTGQYGITTYQSTVNFIEMIGLVLLLYITLK